MITVAEAQETARARLVAKRVAWAADAPASALVIALKPPSEREMLADERGAERWAREWAEARLPDGAVDWETRTWRSIGRQRVPVRLALPGADDVATFVGGDAARAWHRLRERVARLRALRDGDADAGPAGIHADADHAGGDRTVGLNAAIRRHGEAVLRYGDREFDDVVAATRWLIDNPVEGLRPRQLPIRGVDTKWFAAHRGILSALHRAITGTDGLGILDSDPLIRVRVLDPSLAHGGILEFAAPVGVLAALPYRPRAVFVFENLESVLALPPWAGAIAVHGSGYAVDVVGSLSWVQEAPVVYWGDLDSNGFAILHRLRTHHPRVVSVLMDEDTLVAHRDLWVREPTPNRGTFGTLTGHEQRALHRLREEGDVRLEQERIPWDVVLPALRRAWHATGG